jgi:hypothetical protein
MKQHLMGLVLALSSLSIATGAAAQVRVNVNLGTPVNNASWYNTDENYYYLPEQGIYYNPDRRVYVYQENNNWVYGSRLPARYRGYNWNRSHYVRVRERTPFMHHDEYARRFNRGYRGGHVDYRRDNDGYNRDHRNGNDRNYNNRQDNRNDDRRGRDDQNHNNNGNSRNEYNRGR